MILYSHQREVIDAPDEKKRRMFLAHDTGLGKTITILEHVKWLSTAYPQATTLVVVTKTGYPKWLREVEDYLTPENGRDYHTSLEGRVTVLTKEQFKKQAPDLPRFDFVAFDESHWHVGTGSRQRKEAQAFITRTKPDYLWLVSATPYTSTTWSIYYGLQLLGKNIPYNKWRNRFFFPMRMGPRIIWQPRARVDGRPVEDVIADIIRENGFVKHFRDCFDVPDQLDIVEYYPRTRAQEKAIEEVNEATHIAYWTAVHRIENGILPETDARPSGGTLNYGKLDRLIELAEKHEHLVVFARYLEQIDEAASVLRKKGYKVEVINASVPRDRRQDIIDSKPDILLIQASISDSYEVPYARAMVFLSMDFSYVHYKQAHGRLLRANNQHQNLYYHLLTEGVDSDVWDGALSNKKKFSVALYNLPLKG